VAEGVVSCRSVRDLALRHKIDMPITESVYQVCYRHLPPTQMIGYLMDRPHSPE
jgi:glycerol-3-phosphate dehydrogenase (NAD(P)+)